MKILYLANARIPTPRAYGLTIMKTCEAFARAGAEVELITPTRRYKTPGDVFAFYKTDKNFLFTMLSTPDFLHFGSIGFLISATWFAERVRWLKSFREADVICSRDALVLVQYLLLGRKIIFEAHSPPSLIFKIVARRAYRVVCISKGLMDAYIAAGVPSENIIIAPAAVDDHFFDNVPMRDDACIQLGLPISATIVLYTGHLYLRKGAGILASAATLLPNTSFFFVGGTEEDILSLKKRWGNEANIQIVGHVAHERVPFYMRAADVLILPNSGKDEDSARYTSPLKLFEYMASGKPIVASDLPSLREILSEKNAFLVEPDNPEALAEGIRYVLTHPEESKERAMQALEDVKFYTWKSRAKRMLDFIKL
ncbi:MAG: glycosyltransferase family 4 protein [Candidatus Paceibacterota bacterium]|jgi:glycosyltransferase involved in cell wall biosynthesis